MKAVSSVPNVKSKLLESVNESKHPCTLTFNFKDYVNHNFKIFGDIRSHELMRLLNPCNLFSEGGCYLSIVEFESKDDLEELRTVMLREEVAKYTREICPAHESIDILTYLPKIFSKYHKQDETFISEIVEREMTSNLCRNFCDQKWFEEETKSLNNVLFIVDDLIVADKHQLAYKMYYFIAIASSCKNNSIDNCWIFHDAVLGLISLLISNNLNDSIVNHGEIKRENLNNLLNFFISDARFLSFRAAYYMSTSAEFIGTHF